LAFLAFLRSKREARHLCAIPGDAWACELSTAPNRCNYDYSEDLGQSVVSVYPTLFVWFIGEVHALRDLIEARRLIFSLRKQKGRSKTIHMNMCIMQNSFVRWREDHSKMTMAWVFTSFLILKKCL
jgi:hypothetical protein